MQSLIVLGRQPALGLGELESLYGSTKVISLERFALLDMSPNNVNFARLGGAIKLGEVIAEVKNSSWKETEKYIAKAVSELARSLPEGKLKLGLSAYGFENLAPKDIERTAFNIKKSLVSGGRSTRIIVSKELELSSAQVLHNNLTQGLGIEILAVKTVSGVFLARTTNVQDINAYSARDQARPMRDAKVGMLPPKLAQIIINLARPPEGARLLDPFCGSGVVLQEALLMGYSVYGTDIDPRMSKYALSNLKWLKASKPWQVKTADAASYRWESFDSLASETYLGRPLSVLPSRDQLAKNINYVNTLHIKFLKNLATQVKSGFRLCLAVPAWKANESFVHLPLIDHLETLGYNRVKFVHVKNSDLIYFREGQIVARELIVLEKA